MCVCVCIICQLNASDGFGVRWPDWLQGALHLDLLPWSVQGWCELVNKVWV